MNQIKYMTSILIITAILVFTGEMYVWNLDNFETEYISTTMYLPSQSTSEQMVSDIEKSATEHQCGIFIVNRKINTLFSENIDIYCMPEIENSIREKSDIHPGNYHSLILGDIYVNFSNFLEIKDLSRINTYYIYGTLENAREFKRDLVNIYGGSSPQEGYTYLDSRRNVFFAWLIGLFFLSLMTLYETSLIKKEMIVRFIYGDSLPLLILKRYFTDTCIYMSYFVLAYIFLKFSLKIHVDYMPEVTLVCIGIFLLLNFIIYIRLLFINYKSSTGHITGEKKVLNISYIFSTCTIVITTLIISICVDMTGASIEYWSQKDFFETRKEYNYISLTPSERDINQAEKLSTIFLNEKNKSGNVFVNVYLGNGIKSKRPCLIFNKSALNYLIQQCNFLEPNFQEGLYFILPETNQNFALEDITEFAKMYIDDISNNKVVSYTNNTKILGINRQKDIITKYYKNPLIILDLRDELSYFNTMYISQASLFKIDTSEWKKLINSPNIDYNTSYYTNIYDAYNYQLKGKQRILLLSLIIFTLLIFMEAIVIKTILKYECIVNSTELVIKTTLGYSIYEKYRKIIIDTSISIFLCFTGIFIASVIMKEYSLLNSLIGYTINFLIYVTLLFYYIRFTEHIKIQKMLKGSIL